MSSQEQKLTLQKQNQQAKQKANYKQISHSFEIATIITFIILGCCSVFVVRFREMAAEKNIEVLQIGMFKITLIAFCFAFIIRKMLQRLSVNYLESWLHPKYTIRGKQEVKQKLESMGDHFYDLLFHTSMTLFCYYFFMDEDWFPSVLGGMGECKNISMEFSHWPKSQQASIYFILIEIGFYLFLIVDAVFLKQQQLRKYNFGQLIFHHTITFCILISAIFFNQIKLIIIGTLIHDLSDTFRSLHRVIGDLKISFIFPSLFTLSFGFSYASWIYTRLMVMPICLIMKLIDNIPDWNSEASVSIPVYGFVAVISIGLFFLHCYWSVILLRAFRSEKKRNMQYAIAAEKMKQKQN